MPTESPDDGIVCNYINFPRITPKQIQRQTKIANLAERVNQYIVSIGIRRNTTYKHPAVDEARLRDQARGVELGEELVPVRERRCETKILHGEKRVHGSGESTAGEEETDEGAE